MYSKEWNDTTSRRPFPLLGVVKIFVLGYPAVRHHSASTAILGRFHGARAHDRATSALVELRVDLLLLFVQQIPHHVATSCNSTLDNRTVERFIARLVRDHRGA